jgi:hypothetical protein
MLSYGLPVALECYQTLRSIGMLPDFTQHRNATLRSGVFPKLRVFRSGVFPKLRVFRSGVFPKLRVFRSGVFPKLRDTTDICSIGMLPYFANTIFLVSLYLPEVMR